jgi:hypothetical protein
MCLRIIFTSLPLLTQLSFNFFLSSSSHGSNPSSYRHHRLPSRPCHCLIFHRFSFTSRTEHVLKHPSKLKFMKLSFQRAIIRMFQTRELCLFYSDDAIYPKRVFAISPCMGIQNWWFLMHWKDGLMELLKINFSSIVHLWTCAQT